MEITILKIIIFDGLISSEKKREEEEKKMFHLLRMDLEW